MGRWDDARRAGHVNAMCPPGYERTAAATRRLAARLLAELPVEHPAMVAARRYALHVEGGGVGHHRAGDLDLAAVLAAARLLALPGGDSR